MEGLSCGSWMGRAIRIALDGRAFCGIMASGIERGAWHCACMWAFLVWFELLCIVGWRDDRRFLFDGNFVSSNFSFSPSLDLTPKNLRYM